MHICFNALDYPSSLGGSGVGNQVRLLAHALVQAGWRVSVIALAQKGLPEFSDDDGVRVHRVPCGNVHWRLSRIPWLGQVLSLPVRELERSWATWRRIRALHQDEPIDLIEGTETGMLLTALWLPGVPYLVRLHGEPYTFRKYTPGLNPDVGMRLCRLLQRAALRKARLLVSPSLAHAREIAAELGRRRPPMAVAPNMLSPEMAGGAVVARSPDHATTADAGGLCDAIRGPVVLYVGRLEPNKGVPLLLAAARRVLADFPDAHLVLAGGNHPSLPAAELERLLSQVPQRQRVHLLGYVPWRELFAWYRRATVCVLPSYYETFGLAALEPMAFGVPVVLAAAGGLCEIVQDGVSGLLVPRGDEDELARGLVRVLTDAALRRRLGEGGRERAKQFVQTEASVRENLALYRRTSEGSGRVALPPRGGDSRPSSAGGIGAAAWPEEAGAI